MAKQVYISDDIKEVLWDQYCKTVKYQMQKNQIKVAMRFEEYLTLWSAHRINTISKKLAQGPKALNAYFTGVFRPVCSWVDREMFVKGGVMTVEMAKIRTADESKKLFQFKAGDTHSEEAKKRIGDDKRGKKQTPEQIAKRTASRVATMARKKAEREALEASKLN